MKKFRTVFEWIISIAILVIGFLNIPILVWCGVDVSALRGILIFTTLPTVATCAVPFAISLTKHFGKKSKKNKVKIENFETETKNKEK